MIDREQVKRMARACGMDHYEAVTSANVVEPISWVARVEALQRFAALVMMESAERLGQAADKVDNLIGAMQLPLPADFHIKALKEALPTLRDELRAIYVKETGEDPWTSN